MWLKMCTSFFWIVKITDQYGFSKKFFVAEATLKAIRVDRRIYLKTNYPKYIIKRRTGEKDEWEKVEIDDDGFDKHEIFSDKVTYCLFQPPMIWGEATKLDNTMTPVEPFKGLNLFIIYLFIILLDKWSWQYGVFQKIWIIK